MLNYFFVEEKGIEIQTDIERKIKIFIFISREKRWFTLQEISEFLNVSTKTISRDLTYIQGLIPKECNIEVRKGYGVQLIMPTNISVKEIISIIFKESLTFQVFIRLVEKKYSTVNNVAEDLYIQPYQVTKILKKIETYLKGFGVKIKRKPLEIIGEEWDVIYVLCQLYTNLYTDIEWPFLCNQKLINQSILQLEEFSGVSLCLGGRREFSYLIAILLMRKYQGYKIKLITHFSNLNIDSRIYNKLSEVIREVSSTNNINFSIPEKLLLTNTFKYLSSKQFPSENLVLKTRNKNYFNNTNFYTIIRDFMKKIGKELNINLNEDEDLFNTLYEYFNQKLHVLNSYYYLNKQEEVTTKYLQKKYLKTFIHVEYIYNQWVKKHGIAHHVPNEEIANIVMLIEAKRIYEESTPKKVWIVTEEGKYWGIYISAVITKKFGNRISLQSVISLNVESEGVLEDDQDIDFIISTIPIQLNITPVIQIQSIITERDFSNIEEYLVK
ncbi:helix-turn-helix domain-containing protein [Bacillus thuringiensis]|uniref:helix-turn-helix domain-containing protein n=1 Tax=Bacillus thuringiensis TaxID=1428 RepID=UPI0026E3752F|nr:helix-turn-helix domain-containing protein [Bacillus thuringiensis]MDO6632220.1 helix-turn-helix domain-containing protein [Bacillus thuringiensis]MDO6663455.1 helix-turn-helix domain-containing protein [Bacillus thuringiensis]MDO6702424.1 helix-turn-helix domain-containing protein [Bacillus thuringiensis]